VPESASPGLPSIPEDWKYAELGDLLEPDGLSYGIVQPGSEDSDGVPILRVKNLLRGGIQTGDVLRVSKEIERQYSRSRLVGGEVLLSLVGSVGAVAVVPLALAGWNVARAVAVIRVKNQANLWVKYSLSSDNAQHYMGVWQTTTVQATLNLRDVRRLPIVLPPVWERDAIAALLKALDDKIAVNDRIVATSDRLAASVLGQKLAEDDQRSFVPLSEIALVNRRKVSLIPGGFLRYVDISSVSRGNVVWPLRTPWSDAPSRARRGVLPGDTIWSTVRPGRRSYALILADDPEIVVSTGFAVLTPFKVGPAFLYEITKRDNFVQYLENVAEGSAYPAVRADRFERATVPLLSPARLREFEEFAMPLRRHVNGAQTESRILAELRDTLLPKLMTGQIRVRDAERIVEGET
jgi:type I restriction enzyme S subunit